VVECLTRKHEAVSSSLSAASNDNKTQDST
jgi:hypothetical protein